MFIQLLKTRRLIFLLIETHFKATGGKNKAGVDLVLIQPFLFYYVDHVGL